MDQLRVNGAEPVGGEQLLAEHEIAPISFARGKFLTLRIMLEISQRVDWYNVHSVIKFF